MVEGVSVDRVNMCPRDVHGAYEDATPLEASRPSDELFERADEESGGDNEHERERNLGHHKAACQSLSAATGDVAALVLQRSAWIDAARLRCYCRTKEQRCCNG